MRTNRIRSYRLCLGNGTGGFSCSDIDAAHPDSASQTVSLGLIDDDPHLDAVFSNFLQANRVCLGDGLGGFTCSNVSPDENPSGGSALGDFDGDGNLDVVFASYNFGGSAINRACFGDGLGGFTCSDVSSDANDSVAVAAGRVGPEIFADGFESGDTSAWSDVLP